MKIDEKRSLYSSPLSGEHEPASTVDVPPNGIPAQCQLITPSMLPLVELSQTDIDAIVSTIPGGAPNVQDLYPLTPLQEGFLFHRLISPDNDPYVSIWQYAFDSRERLDQYVQALQQVVDRHDVLRTGFLWEHLSTPVQVVLRQATLKIDEIDIDTLDTDTVNGDVAHALLHNLDQHYYQLDIRNAPAIRLLIAHDPANDQWILQSINHHLIGDQITTASQEKEIKAVLCNEQHTLPEPLPFRNFVAQSRHSIASGDYKKHFSQLLGDITEPTAPYNIVELKSENTTQRSATHTLEPALASQARQVCQRLGVTPASLFHLAWAHVLAGLSGTDDVVFGTLMIGRMQGNNSIDQMMGPCINTLPIRINLNEAPVLGALNQTHQTLAQLMAFEHAPLTETQRCSAVAAPTPLFNTLLNYRHATNATDTTVDPSQALGTIPGRTFITHHQRHNSYPITATIDDIGNAFCVDITVHPSLNPTRLCDYLCGSIAQVLNALDTLPETQLTTLGFLPQQEQQLLLEQWNDTAQKFDNISCLYTLFEEQATAHPSRDALIFNDVRLSYGQLNAQANQLAHYLISKGIGPEKVVAIHVDRSIEMVIALLAVHKAGGAYIPLDPDLPIDRLLYMVEDSNATVLLAQRSLSENVKQLAAGIDAQFLDDDISPWSDESTDNPALTIDTDNLAYVLYTSGSTGKPKGVMIEHSQLTHYTLAAIERLGITAPMSFAMVQPFTVDSSVTVVQSSLITGGELHILPKEITLDPDAFELYFAKNTIDCLKLAPSHLSALLPRAVTPEKVLIVGGEALKWNLVDQLDLSGDMTLFNHYGPTETTVGVLTYQVDPQNVIDTQSGSVPVGRPLANTQAYILDKHLNTVPIGVVGGLYIGGPLVARGYLNLPEQTASSFVEDPRDPAARLYYTGDRARYLDNGDIEYMGRADKQLKVRGLRLEPGEIEQAILNDTRIQDTVVTGITTPADQTELVAYVVADTHAAQDKTLIEQLRRSLQDTMPSYMVPTHWLQLDALPRSLHGKLNLSALPTPNLERASSADFVAPTTELEINVAQVWATELGLERVGMTDNFFELGGHSLTLMKVMVELRQLGLNIDAHTFYLAPTIAELTSGEHKQSVSVDVPPNGIPAQCQLITPSMLPLVELSQTDIDAIVSTIPGGAPNVQDLYPLTPLQEGFLFHRLISPDNDPYVSIWQYAFDSRERLDQYVQALQQVVDRHDVLRTGFLWEHLSTPVQVVLRQATLKIDEIDIDTLDTDTVNGDVAHALLHNLDQHYYQLDIRNAPAIRLLIAHDPANDQWILQSINHHLIGDQITTASQEKEIKAVLCNEQHTLPEPLPFRNFVAQSRHSIASGDYKKHFSQLLGDITEPTAPYNIVELKSENTTQRSATHTLEPALASQARQVCQRLGVTPASLFHLAWAHVLAGLSGTDDVVFGTLMIGRMQGNNSIDQMMGPCINTLPIRINLNEAPVLGALNQTHQTLAQLMAFEHAPLTETQRCSAVAAPTPLFNTLLNYRHATNATDTTVDPSQALGTIPGRTFITHHQRHNSYPITATIDDIGNAFCVDITVHPSLNPTRLCDYLCGSIAQVLNALDTLPETQLTTLGFLPQQEQQLLLEQWNATAVDYPAHRTLIELFADQVGRSPHAIAIEDQSGQQIDYLTLNQQSNQLAHHLNDIGMGGPDTSGRIGIYLERNVDMLVALLAVLKAGACYVPMDPLFPPSRLSMMAEDAGLCCVITQRSLAETVPGDVACHLIIDELHDTLRSITQAPLPAPAPETPAYIIYTSGSTGRPKGVSVSHRNLVNFLCSMQRQPGIVSSDHLLAVTTLSFDIAMLELYLPLISGARTILASREQAMDPQLLMSRLEQAEVTMMQATPATWRNLLNGGWRGKHGLKVLCGGEALPLDLAHALLDTGAELWNLYGPTETTIWSTAAQIHAGATAINVGSPIANTQVYIVDQALSLAPVGVIGELCIGGDGVSMGYLDREDLTNEKFVANPFSDEPERLIYRTGDRARWTEDGQLQVLGRLDEQVKLRGYRLEPGEVRARLVEHDSISDAIVIVREDTPDNAQLAAYLVPSATKDCNATTTSTATVSATTTDAAIVTADTLDINLLRETLRQSLPEYMIPTVWVTLNELPLTPNGKVDRKQLPAPSLERSSSTDYVAPSTELEIAIANNWAAVLGVDRVGMTDNFFELGGHSLTLMKVMVELRQLGLNIDAHTFYLAPTIAELTSGEHKQSVSVDVPPNGIPAQCQLITPSMLPLVELSQTDIDAIVSTIPGGAPNVQDLYPLTPLQEGFLFHRLISPDNDPYVSIWQYAFDSRERLDQYVQALQQVVDRHDVLRTGFLWEHLSTPVQVVLRQATLKIDEIDIDTLDTDTVNGDVAHALLHNLDQHYYQLDIRNAPAIRLLIAHDPANDQWILQSINHHLIGDQITTASQEKEIKAVLCNEQHTLPEPLPFRNFVAQSRHSIASGDYKKHFSQLLGDITEPTAPYNIVELKSENTTQRSATHTLEPALASQARQVCQRLGVTPASLFHLAWAHVLAGLSGTDDVVFGTLMIGRMQGNNSIDQMMGPCINTLPIRINLNEAPVLGALNQTHQTLAQLMAFEHAPLTETQRCSAVAAPTPLFNTLLNYRHATNATDTTVDPSQALGTIPGRTFITHHQRHNSYPITATIDDIGNAFCVDITVHPSLNPTRLCDYLCGSIAQVLNALDTLPETQLTTLGFLPQQEQQLLLEQWNATAVDYPAHRTLIELFADQVGRSPHAIAIEDQSGQQIDYLTLNQQSNQLAHHLNDIGMGGPDTSGRIGIYLERNVDMLVALLAVLKAGACYVPMDPLFPPSRLSMMAEDAGLCCVITQRSLAETVPGDVACHLIIDELHDTLRSITQAPLPAPAPETPAYIIYTSGSTGRPKGVSVSHRNLVNFLCSMQRQPGIVSSDHLLAVTTLSFDIAMLELYLPLISGARTILASREQAMDPQLLMSRLEQAEVTMMQATPATWRNLLNGGWRGKHGLKVLCGGEALPLDLAHALLDTGAELWNLYGPTETTIWSTAAQIHAGATAINVGSPIANTQVYIVDQALSLAPVGVIGELCIGGDGVSMGYLDREDLTNEKFVANPFSDEPERLIYRTGDRARWTEDGQLQVLGRLDEQVKLRGYRLEPGEVRARLVEHDSISDAIVIVREDTPDNAQLAAYLVPSATKDCNATTTSTATVSATTTDAAIVTADTLDINLLRETLRQSLPEYMIPTVWVTLNELPLTPNGKVDRKQLPAPSLERSSSTDYVAPSTELEIAIANNWAAVLGVDRVGMTDSFFKLGGNSLNAVKLIVEMERQHGVKVPLIKIFQGVTVKEICELQESSEAKFSLNEQLKCRLITRPGSKTPLFMAGSNPGYSVAAMQFNKDQPAYQLDAYALQHNLLLKKQKALRSIETIAKVFVEEIRSIQPKGPYYISGGCEGAVVAYEIGRQLTLQGESLAQLIVWGVPGPGQGIREAFAGSSLRRLWWQFQSIRAKGSLSELGIAAYRELIRHEYIEYTLFTAMLKYQTDSILDIDARYIKLEDSMQNKLDPTNGWNQYFNGSVYVDKLPGNHDNWLIDHPDDFGRYLDAQIRGH